MEKRKPVGPQLPGPSAATASSAADGGPGPAAIGPATPRRARVIGPALPPGFGATDNEDGKGNGNGSDHGHPDEEEEAQPRHPNHDDSTDSSDDDDDDGYGPTLPTATTATTSTTATMTAANTTLASTTHSAPDSARPLQRDDWMLRPPDSSDWASRIDPTKIRSRRFATGRAAAAPKAAAGAASASAASPGGLAGTWTETAEEKQQRLAAELMGVRRPASLAGSAADAPAGAAAETSELDRLKKKQVDEYNAQRRRETLYDKHRDSRSRKRQHGQDGAAGDEDDDPSARPFDKEKDIRGPTKVSNAKRREFLHRASDFGSRFAGGKFL
ncbi:hypothetical protein KEM52_001457 [Ascosphaera acerosa]|nr:hypothetical protein KEM52_001457 [Ascosphaera acerosa]